MKIDYFVSMVLEKFWTARLETYSKLAEKVLTVLLPFSTIYQCETKFSSLMYLQNKYRNRLGNV